MKWLSAIIKLNLKRDVIQFYRKPKTPASDETPQHEHTQSSVERQSKASCALSNIRLSAMKSEQQQGHINMEKTDGWTVAL